MGGSCQPGSFEIIPALAEGLQAFAAGRPSFTVDSKQLEYGPGTICAGFPSSLGFGVWGQSYSNFLTFTVS